MVGHLERLVPRFAGSRFLVEEEAFSKSSVNVSIPEPRIFFIPAPYVARK